LPRPNPSPMPGVVHTLGASSLGDGRTHFLVWAPRADEISLVLYPDQKEEAMSKVNFGYWEKTIPGIKPGTRYKYKIDGGDSFPDPASLSQPEGVHGLQHPTSGQVCPKDGEGEAD